jgi:hypothetical protein
MNIRFEQDPETYIVVVAFWPTCIVHVAGHGGEHEQPEFGPANMIVCEPVPTEDHVYGPISIAR